MNRREFILTGAAAAFVAGCKCPLCGGGLSKKAVQAYSLRDLLVKDFAGTCDSLAKLGLDGLEMWGTSKFAAKDVRRSLDASGLVASAAHVDIEALRPENLNRTFDYAETVGCTRIIVPWLMPEGKALLNERAWWLGNAEILNGAAAAAEGRGLTIGYHNHDHEFGKKLGGQTIWELFTGAFRDDIFIQWDVGALAHAGQDAASWMRKYPGRCPTVHMKDDWDKSRGCWGVIGEPPPGRPGVDWPSVVAELKLHPVEWTVVEPATSDRLDTVAQSLAKLKSFGV